MELAQGTVLTFLLSIGPKMETTSEPIVETMSFSSGPFQTVSKTKMELRTPRALSGQPTLSRSLGMWEEFGQRELMELTSMASTLHQMASCLPLVMTMDLSACGTIQLVQEPSQDASEGTRSMSRGSSSAPMDRDSSPLEGMIKLSCSGS